MVAQMVVGLVAGRERSAASLPAGRLGCWRRASRKRLLPSAFGHLSWLFCSLVFGGVCLLLTCLHSLINHTCWGADVTFFRSF